jgi:hypothetical protein
VGRRAYGRSRHLDSARTCDDYGGRCAMGYGV